MLQMITETGHLMKYRELLKSATILLENAGIADASNDAWILMEYCFDISRTDYYMKTDEDVPEEKCRKYNELIEKRANHIPLQYITGIQNFMGFDFKVNENVLIPRQDTESVVDKAVNYIGSSEKKVLDMCTGSGCIAITVDKLCKNSIVKAADLSEKALNMAIQNNKLNNADVTFIKSDLFDDIEGKYDVIISNPPYIPTEVIDTLDEEVRCHEPHMALDGTKDGLEFYRKISYDSRAYFGENGGDIFYEIGCEQADDVSDILMEAGYSDIKVIKDLAGLDRGIWAKYK